MDKIFSSFFGNYKNKKNDWSSFSGREKNKKSPGIDLFSFKTKKIKRGKNHGKNSLWY